MKTRPRGLQKFHTALLAAWLALGVFIVPNIGRAISPDEILKDPKLEARARAISSGLRCPKCQSESIDDSNAEIAKDLRLMVRERLLAGDTDDEVRNFLVARYGEFILLRPRFSGQTLLLWIAPFAILLAGGAFLWRAMRRGEEEQAGKDNALDTAEETALKSLLAGANRSNLEDSKAK